MRYSGLIVGLGNPGRKYAWTRHNMGFMLLDRILALYSGFISELRQGKLKTSKIWIWSAQPEKKPWLLAKPLTYMNQSGTALREIICRYNIALEDVLVMHDELDLPLGRVRYKFQGGMAGHKGLISIAAETGSNQFHRLRLGIGRPEPGTGVVEHVLSRFPAHELSCLQHVLSAAAKAVYLFSARDIQAAADHLLALQPDS